MLKNKYNDSIIRELQDELNITNVLGIPKITKISVNVGVGEVVHDNKIMDYVISDLTKIVGQRVLVTKARNSIAGFKIRKGMLIGCKVDLRRCKMYEFMERLMYFALPAERDFRGLSPKQFDGLGNYNFGIKEHIVFKEINYDSVYKIFGMDISIVTSTSNDKHAKLLLNKIGFPFNEGL
ncbi:MAG: 50S ribosomal protein L5 [Anaplasmataceae bacterium]|nr:50S ribosomal protein L5 [Anaplasmataceae bacterium]